MLNLSLSLSLSNLKNIEERIFCNGASLDELAVLYIFYRENGNIQQMRRILHLMEAHTAHAASQLDGCKTVVMRKGEAAFTRQENGFSFSIDSVSAFLARPEGFMHYARLLRLPEVGEVVITTPLAREAADLAAILRLEALRAGKACRVLMPDDPARRAAGSITAQEKQDAAWLEELLECPREIMLSSLMGPCNIRCRFCEQAYEKIPFRKMDFGVFRETVAALPKDRFIKTIITPYMEPLAISDHRDYLEYLLKERPGLNVGFNTNGSHLTREKADMLVDLGLKYIIISMNMPDADSYRWFTGRDYFDRVCAGVRFLHEAKKRAHARFPVVTVQFLKFPPAIGQEEALRDKWLQHADQVWFRNISAPAAAPEKVRELEEKSGGALIATQQVRPETYPCVNLFTQMSVDMDGVYRPCCFVTRLGNSGHDAGLGEAQAGSVFKSDFLSAWRGQAQNRLRALQIANVLSVCRNCLINQTDMEQLVRLRNAVYDRFYRDSRGRAARCAEAKLA